jgi:hypothetical protein
MTFIVILDSALLLVLLVFNGWNWFLAMTGVSTIEFWGAFADVSSLQVLINFIFRRLMVIMTSSLER